MASRAETVALRGRGQHYGHGLTTASADDETKWTKRVGIAVGLAICVGVVMTCWTSSIADSPLVTTNLSAHHVKLRGKTNASETGDDGAHKPVYEMPSRAWNVVSGPQHGPPPGMEDEPLSDEQASLKDLLLAHFGLDKAPPPSEAIGSLDLLSAHEDDSPMKDVQPTPRSNLDDMVPSSVKLDLKEMLLKHFGLNEPSKLTGEAVPTAITESDADIPTEERRWNWLHPATVSYLQVKDTSHDTVQVTTVLEHLHRQRMARARDLVIELHRVDAQYNRTRACFTRGSAQLQKPEMTRREYEHIVRWMDAICPESDEQRITDAHNERDGTLTQKTAFMTKDEFKASIAEQFERALDVSTKGRDRAKLVSSHAETTKEEIAACIDRAAESAVNAATGLIQEAKLNASISWIINDCVRIP